MATRKKADPPPVPVRALFRVRLQVQLGTGLTLGRTITVRATCFSEAHRIADAVVAVFEGRARVRTASIHLLVPSDSAPQVAAPDCTLEEALLWALTEADHESLR